MRKISSSLERIGLLSGEGILEAVQDIARISFSIRGEGESVGGNLREAAIKILDASKTYLGRNYRVGILDPVQGSGFNPNLHESRGLASNGETGEISQNATILVHSVEMIGFCRGTEILEKARVKVTFKK
jgi:hypothetical protein